MDRPSIFSSVRYGPGVFASQSASSSAENTLSRLIIRLGCSTSSNALETGAPTSFVGDSGTASSGCASSNATRRWYSSSNSLSEITGWPL